MTEQWYEGRGLEGTTVWLPHIGGSTPTINLTSEIALDPDGKPWESGEDTPTPEIEIF
jgi:hypothetical protein